MRGDFGLARITLFTLVKSANVWEWALRVNATPYERLICERLAGLREIVMDPVRCPLAYEEFRLKEFERDRDGTWVDEIPDGNDHGIDAVRYAVMDDVLRGHRGFSTAPYESIPSSLKKREMG